MGSSPHTPNDCCHLVEGANHRFLSHLKGLKKGKLCCNVKFLGLVPQCSSLKPWFLYLVSKSFSVSPMYVSEVLLSLRVMVAW